MSIFNPNPIPAPVPQQYFDSINWSPLDYTEANCQLLYDSSTSLCVCRYRVGSLIGDVTFASMINKSPNFSFLENPDSKFLEFVEYLDYTRAHISTPPYNTSNTNMLIANSKFECNICNFVLRVLGIKTNTAGISYIIGMHLLHPNIQITKWKLKEIRDDDIKSADTLLKLLDINNVLFQVFDPIFFWKYFKTVVSDNVITWRKYEEPTIAFLSEFRSIVNRMIESGHITQEEYANHIGYMDDDYVYINSKTFCTFCAEQMNNSIHHINILKDPKKLIQEISPILVVYDNNDNTYRTIPKITKQRFFRISKNQLTNYDV